MRPRTSFRLLGLLGALTLAACASATRPRDGAPPVDATRDATDVPVPFDAPPPPPPDAPPPPPPDTAPPPPDATPCTLDPQCDDGFACTVDRCDTATRTCTHTPVDSVCQDGDLCNGAERCDPRSPAAQPNGCVPSPPDRMIDCDDGNICTVDTCDPPRGCLHAPRDIDGDGHADRMCMGGDDCNDGDPMVFPGAVENCTDGRDNDCDMLTDLADPGCSVSNDTCATATALPGAGMYTGTTVGLAHDYALSCSPGTAADAVYSFTLTDRRDVTVTLFTSGSSVALVTDCGPPLAEVRCTRDFTSPTLRARGLGPGTYRLIFETGFTPGVFRFGLELDPPAPPPAGDVCPTATDAPVDLAPGVPQIVSLAPLEDDYELSCNRFGGVHRDAVRRVVLAAPSDVRITATAATSSTALSLRGAACPTTTSELRCAAAFSGATTISQRALPAGTYWLLVENNAHADVTLTLEVSPPTPTVTYTVGPAPATVSFTDVCAMAGATRVLPSVDDAQAAVPMGTVPFPLRMYGVAATSGLTVSSNGWLSLAPGASGALSGTVPDPSPPNLTLAPAWSDQITGPEGVCLAVVGAAPARRFIVQWANMREFGGTGAGMQYEVVINEQASPSGNNLIDFVYAAFSGASRTYGAGIENDDGTVGTIVPPPLTAPRALRFTPSM